MILSLGPLFKAAMADSGIRSTIFYSVPQRFISMATLPLFQHREPMKHAQANASSRCLIPDLWVVL